MKLPIKTRVLEMAILKNGPFTAEEFSELLKIEYNGEKSTTLKNIQGTLEMFSRVNFLKADKLDLDSNGELLVTYIITDTGKESLKYIPGHGNKLF